MSGITSAFNVARSGLAINSQWSEVVSGNIANADNPDYGRRTLNRASFSDGSVVATGVIRATDASLTRMFREEYGRMTRQEALSTGLTAYTTALGSIDDAGAPTQLLSQFQTSLDFLFNDPGQSSLQQAALQSAQALTRGLNRVSGDLDTATNETYQRLTSDMTEANKLMQQISDVNTKLARTEPNSALYVTLKDQQESALNQLSAYADIKISDGPQGSVNVRTTGGARLIDGTEVFNFEYDRGTGVLTAGGYEVTPGRAIGVSEGSIAGHVELLVTTLPKIRLQLDEFARGLIQTFENSDASIAPPAAGLFTDNGAAYDPASLTGLAGRISVNDAVNPNAGGALWRLRDGIGATTPGAQGESTQLGAFIDALDAPQSFDGASGLPTGIALSEFGAAMISAQQDIRARADEAFDNYAASAGSIDDARLNAQGVSLDDELQQLLMVEKSYAANAQVISALSDMLDALLAAT
ncbi:flagellar hook-associated protein FlgK [Seohaeicola zhoushanensis]|uniref:Flagellar hook-associated protein 1 n=1 Tax=Seohaeicola zhoushanensis TaxID=1569283 RepID=A0A8J3GUJ7_9RHOB|nr:flagellar hook-associated protein FlgK [Seohaeicola zhoushanensis]GHF36257.1 flagellar hook protein FlgK [Seohaeicola zhoushanensis]